MPTVCFSPGCKSGYKSEKKNDEKRHFFLAPKDKGTFEKWMRAIPRADKPLGKSSRICDLHFDEADILNQDEFISDGIKEVLPREKWTLKPGAVPTKFPNLPHYLSGTKKTRKSPKKRSCSPCLARSKRRRKTTDEAIDGNFTPYEFNHLLNDIKNKDISQQLPSSKWIISKMDEPDGSCSLLALNVIKECGIPQIKKALEVTEQLKLSLFCDGTKVLGLLAREELKSTEDFFIILEEVDKFTKCPGAFPVSMFSHERKLYKGVVKGTHWHSIHCAQLVSLEGVRCNACRGLRRIIQTRIVQDKRKCLKTRKMITYSIKQKYCRINRKNPRQQLKTANRRLKRYHSKLVALKSTISALKNEIRDMPNEILQQKLKTLPKCQQLVFEHCLKKANCSKRGMRYTKQWLLECLLLCIKSPKAYKHILNNKLLPLPHPSTVQKVIAQIPARCGFTDFDLKAIEKQLSGKSIASRSGTVCFDEIKLQQGTSFDPNTLQFIGFVGYGQHSNQSNMLADHGLVFVYQSLLEKWIQPIGIFLAKNATPGNVLAKLLMECVILLEKHGAQVVSVVCDGAATNKSLWQTWNISGKKTRLSYKIPHPCAPDKRSLYFMTDPPHIIKCMRNHFLKHRIVQFGQSVVSYTHYEKLHEENKKCGVKRIVPCLTDAHIQPNNFEKMNVRLAVQLFSKSVADGLKLMREAELPSFQECGPIEAYTRSVNDLFDALNAKLPCQGIRPNSNAFNDIKKFLEILDESEEIPNITGIPAFASVQTLESLRVTLNSVLDATSYLFTVVFKYVLTAKFNQDCMERFFGLIRSAGYADDHPKVPNFLFLFRLFSVYTPVKTMLWGNVEPNEERVLAWIGDCMTPKGRATAKEDSMKKLLQIVGDEEDRCLFSLQHDHDYESSKVADCIVYHLAGYIAHKMKKVSN